MWGNIFFWKIDRLITNVTSLAVGEICHAYVMCFTGLFRDHFVLFEKLAISRYNVRRIRYKIIMRPRKEESRRGAAWRQTCFDTSEGMTSKQRIPAYLNLNRVLLLAIGLWPYQRSKLISLQFVLLFSILLSFILLQLGTLVILRCTTDLVLKILFIAFFFSTCVINYTSFYVNIDAVKSLTQQIQHNYDKLKDEGEIAIMNKYGNRTKHFTSMCIVLFICTIYVLLLSQFWPCILDVIQSANKTRPINSLRFISEYYIDNQKYLYLIVLYTNAAFFIACLTTLSTGTMLLAYGQYICGMLKIASYRIQYAMRPNVKQPINLQKKNPIYERIIYAVDIHRKTLQFSESLMSTFALWFFLLIGAGVISMSLNLIQIFLILSSGYNVVELTIQVIFLFCQYFYMFMANYVAQEVADHNNHVFTSIYNIQWYVTPLHVQKMILFMLQRGTKPYHLQLGSVFVGSLEGFASLMSASITYFTVIYSIR
ncbi:uncharacterized protein LOC109503870 [Harpegnathos saltator]|uniref:uncharacterized protein LOC109503870 n=1 Tax=Harpegnathos saltator TaxID=610380 RepID=UPI000DBED6F8|nr:uncharacterized protein LOC109503870 [Harpegnathos saltator]